MKSIGGGVNNNYNYHRAGLLKDSSQLVSTNLNTKNINNAYTHQTYKMSTGQHMKEEESLRSFSRKDLQSLNATPR